MESQGTPGNVGERRGTARNGRECQAFNGDNLSTSPLPGGSTFKMLVEIICNGLLGNLIMQVSGYEIEQPLTPR